MREMQVRMRLENSFSRRIGKISTNTKNQFSDLGRTP